jgi:phenylalanyl-tRNA synthetase alpha subunit
LKADIADVLRGAWKTVKLKAYNFKSKGALAASGALHPRTEWLKSVNQICVEMLILYPPSEQGTPRISTNLL